MVNRDKKIESEGEGSEDLYDIIKFCCAIKENPRSPNKEWSRKYSSDLNSMVYENSIRDNGEYDEKLARFSVTPKSTIYAMTAITALNSGDGERAVWNTVSHNNIFRISKR